MRLPRKDWHIEAATFDSQRTQRLQKAMAAWIGARRLRRAEFGKQLVSGSASDAAVDSLRAAAEAVRTATTHRDLGDASKHLADAMLGIGLNRWSGFLRDAADQADSYTPPAGNRVYAQLATNTATDASSGGSAATAASEGRYVANNPEQWAGRASVGTGECVPLVQQATGAPHASAWRQGAMVKGNTALAPGTAIATFDAAGRYANHSHGRHAAIYLSQDASGIKVIDQWNRRDAQGNVFPQPPHIRVLQFNDRLGASDNGNKFSVVE